MLRFPNISETAVVDAASTCTSATSWEDSTEFEERERLVRSDEDSGSNHHDGGEDSHHHVSSAARALVAALIALLILAVHEGWMTAAPADTISDKEKPEAQYPSLSLARTDGRCFVQNEPLVERAERIIQASEIALSLGIGNCENETVTSLNQTATAFHEHNVLWTESDALFTGVVFVFRAIGANGIPRTVGGDEFVVTVSGWTTSGDAHGLPTVAYKTAAESRDYGNGTYTSTVRLPKLRVDSYAISLSHYSTCHEGFGSVFYGSKATKLDNGPQIVHASENLADYLLSVDSDKQHNSSVFSTQLQQLPDCEASQEGIERMTNGLWIEQGLNSTQELTLRALWTPFCCRRRSGMQPMDVKQHRIGDSTMPRQNMQVGDVFDITKKFRDVWIDYLWTVLSNGTEVDTAVFSAGLHQLMAGYKPKHCVELVQRMICQLSLFFPGKIVFIGPAPIQQQLYAKVDMTDQNSLLLNSMLRQKMHLANGRLVDLCADSDVAVMLNFPDTNGDLLNVSATNAKAIEERESLNLTISENELKLTQRLQSLSLDGRKSAYGNRTIFYAEIEGFLRPRPETYRDHDKVHDLLITNGAALFWGEHSNVIQELLFLRSEAPP